MRSTYWRKSDQSSFTAKLAACSCNMQMNANDNFILTNWNSMHAIATCKDANQGLSWKFETAGAIPSLLCRLQILVGWELEQFFDRKGCVTQLGC